MSAKILGIIFPGQGSQSVGMLVEIAEHFDEVQQVFSRASHVLGYDLWKLVSEGPSIELDKTEKTQPALLAASYALWQIISQHKSIHPVVFAGHSLGEYSALVCAEAIQFEDAIKLVQARGQFMQEAVPVGQGALAAIVGLENDAVMTLCETSVQNNEVLTPVNYNSPGQVVIGGHIAAVERALVLAKNTGAKLAKLLPVSVPSHCALMKPAAEKLSNMLNSIQIKSPRIPVVNNVDVTVYQNPDMIRDGLTRQLFMPVRWVEVIHSFSHFHIEHLIECGPGKVLTGLVKRINNALVLSTTSDLESLRSTYAVE